MSDDFDFCTKNCVVCGEPATIFGGHVHGNIWHLFAGWCRDHRQENYISKPPWVVDLDPDEPCKSQMGCYGRWVTKMGLRIRVNSGIYKSGRLEITIP